jgi:hypothetical protein
MSRSDSVQRPVAAVDGREQTKRFARKADAQKWLDTEDLDGVTERLDTAIRRAADWLRTTQRGMNHQQTT